MASTPDPQLIPIKIAARKLPIKRKTPDTPHINPNPNPYLSPNFVPKHEPLDSSEDFIDGDDLKPSPFKFHRIWTESDELRFLQGLLDSSAHCLAFPRDLHVFYHRFSQSIPQPYTKSQLSEKLRRLRKKFHVISARISRGLDPSLLSSHDRSLFDLSKQLWHPSYLSSSPFLGNNKKNSGRVRVKVSFSPDPSLVALQSSVAAVNENRDDYVENDDDDDDDDDDAEDDDVDNDVGVNFESNLDTHKEESILPSKSVGGDGTFSAKTVLDVFGSSLKEVQMALVHHGSSKQRKVDEFTKRWQELRIAELDVLARRSRLVLEKAMDKLV